MNILFCGNDKVEEGLILSILSLKNNIDEQLNIYILTMKLVTDDKVYSSIPGSTAEYLDSVVKDEHPASSVDLIDITELYDDEIPKANLNTRFTPYCMLRLFADEVTELPDKILYLDTDVVCRRGLSDFYHQDITGYEMGGVLDHYGKWFFRKNLLKSDYINSGVLMMNLKLMRQTGLLRKCRQVCVEKRMFMPDQSALNKYAVSKNIYPRRYNEQKKLRNDTVLQHFTTTFRFSAWLHPLTVKPWQVEKVHKILKLYEYDELFDEYLDLLPVIKPGMSGGESYEY